MPISLAFPGRYAPDVDKLCPARRFRASVADREFSSRQRARRNSSEIGVWQPDAACDHRVRGLSCASTQFVLLCPCLFIRNHPPLECGLLPQIPRKEGVCCLLRFGTFARASRSCRRIFCLQASGSANSATILIGGAQAHKGGPLISGKATGISSVVCSYPHVSDDLASLAAS